MAYSAFETGGREALARLAFAVLIFMGLKLGGPEKPKGITFPPVNGEHTVLINRVIDGDTVEFYYLVGPENGRLYGCNAPEKNTEAGQRSAEALSAILKPQNLVTCEFKGPDKFGRALVNLKDTNGKSVTSSMIGAGHARPWDGQGPKP